MVSIETRSMKQEAGVIPEEMRLREKNYLALKERLGVHYGDDPDPSQMPDRCELMEAD